MLPYIYGFYSLERSPLGSSAAAVGINRCGVASDMTPRSDLKGGKASTSYWDNTEIGDASALS